MNYLCYQQEKAPQTGKLHWQGYVEFNKPRRGTTADKLLVFGADGTKDKECKLNGSGAVGMKNVVDGWMQKSTKSALANGRYCSKAESAIEGTFAEFGKPMTQGERSDLTAAAALLKEKGDVPETWLAMNPDTAVRYGGALLRYHKLIGGDEKERKKRAPKVTIYWGPPGTGKSRTVHELLEGKRYYKCECNRSDGNAWWAGYRGHTTVFFDEYEPGQLATGHLLRIIDWYSTRVHVYGNEVQLMANKFYFTSNTDPRLWVKEANRKAAWLRRLEQFAIIHEVNDEDALPAADDIVDYV